MKRLLEIKLIKFLCLVKVWKSIAKMKACLALSFYRTKCKILNEEYNKPEYNNCHMYSFFELFARHNINLTDFQFYYYDYNSKCKSMDLSFITPADVFKDHKEYYINAAAEIIKKYSNNIYFDFCEKEKYEKFLSNPNSTNAKKFCRHYSIYEKKRSVVKDKIQS